jgi:hypothetical protein
MLESTRYDNEHFDKLVYRKAVFCYIALKYVYTYTVTSAETIVATKYYSVLALNVRLNPKDILATITLDRFLRSLQP